MESRFRALCHPLTLSLTQLKPFCSLFRGQGLKLALVYIDSLYYEERKQDHGGGALIGFF